MPSIKRKHLYLFAVIALISLCIIVAGGCGGGDGGANKVYVMGKMHGDLANELEYLCDVSAYDGANADAPLIISYSDGFTVGDNAPMIRKFINAGKSVALEHADEREINDFLDAVGFSGGFVMPSGDHYVEYYGVKVLSGDIFTYVMLNDNETQPVVLNYKPESYMSGDVEVSADIFVSPQAVISGDEITAIKSGDQTLAVNTGTEALSVRSLDELMSSDRVTLSDDLSASDEMEMARSIVKWMNDGETQAKAAARSKAAQESALNAASGGNDLTQISRMYQISYNASQNGSVFVITTDVYGCHTYNMASKEDSDWFFIKEKAQLNPAANYRNFLHNGVKALACVKGYMVEYSFDNWTVNADGSPSNNAELMEVKPDTSIGSHGFSSGISTTLGGNIGFSGIALSGGLSLGVSYSTDESQTVDECQVRNESKGSSNNVILQNAKWKYTFSRPLIKEEASFCGAADFYDAPLASRSLFQPVNQWAWRIPPLERDKIKGFKCRFGWVDGRSDGCSYALWIKMLKETHQNWRRAQQEFYIPFAEILPPLIAANNLDFSKAADHKRLELGTARNWTAASGASWCNLSQTAGTMSDAENGVYVDVSENNTGANRETFITLKTKDGKGTSKVRVFQSRY